MPGRKILLVLFTSILAVIETQAQDQKVSLRDLLGKWQSINAPEDDFQINFVDSNHVYFIREEGNPVNNFLLGYLVDTLKNELILSIIYPNGFEMKLFLWIKNKTQIKMLWIDMKNYKDPMKEKPAENHPKTIVFRKLNELKSA